ncbi:TPA: hypothetical protein VEQ20_005162 [Raoultella ornithinolytica]|uniref:Lipoprotein n=1 Tax=Klebsiella quasipneumoniae TaxID=1463165 RepID=A0ABD7NB24_9ENTR|nr:MULTISPECIES: hypothetical protein [Klebsiella/Raoultella group]HEQ2050916.1 hypothetical protein [Raoultella ornithinolytica]PXH49140.1 hypothetical protein DMQ64_00020 [Klebsiella pneumoniae]UAN12449.1 hypothetical protein KGP19_09525 [Raoultella planticola]SSG06044.1 Uncharacterised protein [Klebsiella quasipneumoniae]SSH03976.1 Uncharacterised protein [Klebsiella quasipneumoniae]
MNGKTKLVIVGGVLAVAAGIFWAGYLKGWYAHSEHVNSQAKERLPKQEKAVAAGEQKAATANAEAKVIYRTVYRDVVKYVNDPNHIVCKFDPDAVQLRQRAIDAANTIPGFDEPAVQNK